MPNSRKNKMPQALPNHRKCLRHLLFNLYKADIKRLSRSQSHGLDHSGNYSQPGCSVTPNLHFRVFCFNNNLTIQHDDSPLLRINLNGAIITNWSLDLLQRSAHL